MANRLELAKISVTLGTQTVVREVSFKLAAGQIGCVLGPAGSGKSTLLRAIAGFERLAQGAIHLDEARVSSSEAHIAPDLRGIGMVFADAALFPHLTVGDNVGFSLRKLGGKESAIRMVEAMHKVGLRDLRELDSRYPHQLSAEQQFRVALARALASKPRLLLIDAAFAGLEPSVRERLPGEVRDLLRSLDITALLATDNYREAFTLADEIGVLSGGRLLQWGDAETLYQRPANRFVASSVGEASIIHAQLLGNSLVCEFGTLPAPVGADSLRDRPRLEILLRPQNILLQAVSKAEAGNARITRRCYRGPDILHTLKLASGAEVLASTTPDTGFAVGDSVLATLKSHPLTVLHRAE